MNFKFGKKYIKFNSGISGSIGQDGIQGREGIDGNPTIIDRSDHQGMSGEINTPFENHNSHFITIMNRLIENYETEF